MTYLNQFHKEAMERTMKKIAEFKKSPMNSKGGTRSLSALTSTTVSVALSTQSARCVWCGEDRSRSWIHRYRTLLVVPYCQCLYNKKAVRGRPCPFKKEWRSFNKAAAKIGVIFEQSKYFETFLQKKHEIGVYIGFYSYLCNQVSPIRR